MPIPEILRNQLTLPWSARFHRIFLIVSLMFLLPITARTDDQIILDVVVNGHQEGKHFFVITEDNDILTTSKFLTGIRLRPDLWSEGDRKLSLRKLAPTVQFTIDQNNAVLTITVEPAGFESQTITTKKDKPNLSISQVIHYPRSFAAFFNYQPRVTYQEGSGVNSYSLPMEIGANWKRWFFLSNFSIDHSGDQQDFSRLMTSLTWDNPSRRNRLILGDFNAPTTNLLTGGLFGGISWGTHFALDHDFKPYPDLQIDTIITTPTRAELYNNGQIVKEWDLLPGPVNFSDLDLYAGSDAELVLRDIYGREQRIQLPALFRGRGLLRKGVHEYSYNLGFTREEFGTTHNEYDKLTLLGFHRYGFTNNFSPGFHYSLQDDFVNIGPTAGYRIGDHILDLEGMYSYNNGEDGYALAMGHAFRWGNFNSYLKLWGFSRDFSRQSSYFPADSEIIKYQGNIMLNYNWRWLGSFSAGYNESCWWNDDISSQAIISYQKKIINPLNMSLNMRFNLRGVEEDQVILGLSYNPTTESEQKFYDNIGYRFKDAENSGSEHEMRMRKNSGMGTGLGYNFSLNQQEEGTSGGGRAEYKNEHIILSSDLNQNYNGDKYGSLGAAGGIALLDGGFYFGRPVTDSFAVVELEGVNNVPIYHNNKQVGIIDDGEALLVPSLMSYGENMISIRPADMPLHYEFLDKKQFIKVGQRSGTKLLFQGVKFSAVEGHIYTILPNGKRESLTAMPVEIGFNDHKKSGFTGEDGYFYLENIPAGNHLLHVYRTEGNCVALLKVRQTNNIINNLGNLDCRPIEQELSKIYVNPLTIGKKQKQQKNVFSNIRLKPIVIKSKKL